MAQTKVTGGLLSTTSNYEVGVITATKFVGPFGGTSDRGAGYFSSLDVTGDVDIKGTLSYVDVDNITATGIITAQDSVQIGAGLSVAGVSTFTSSVGIADSIIHLGNTDTSIRFPADDTFAVDIAGTEKFFIDANGSVGIGTHEIDEPLDVYGNFVIGARDTTDAQISVGRTDAGNRNAYIDLIGDNTYSDYGLRLIRQNGGANAASSLSHRGTGTLEIAALEAAPISIKNGGTSRLYIKTTGEVGIGSESPNAKFVVSNEGENGFEFNPNFNSNNSIIASYNRHAAVDAYTQLTLSASQHIFSQGGTEYGRFNANGRLGIGTDSPAGNLEIDTASSTTMIMLDASGTNFARIGHNSSSGVAVLDVRSEGHTRFLTNGNNERLRIKSDGSVGIGTGDPGRDLHLWNATEANLKIEGGADYAELRVKDSDDAFGLHLNFAGAGSHEVIHITSDHRIGINDTTPNDYELDIMKRSAATDANIRLYNNATGSTNDTVIRSQIGGTTANNYLYFGDSGDSNVGQIRYSHSTDAMTFNAAAAEVLKLDSTGATVTGKVVASGEIEAAQDYPDFRPTLDFNFAAVKKLDSRITYTRTGPASYTDEFGIVKLVGPNAPRFDHDPVTGECKGLLIEESRTNYCKSSSDLSNLWAAGGGSYGIDTAITNPDGTVGAHYHTGSELYHNMDISGASTDKIRVSMWVKERSGQSGNMDIQIYEQITGSALNIGGPGFNPATGVIASSTHSSDEVVYEYPNGWYRIAFTMTSQTANFTASSRIDLQNKEHYVWGIQVEAATFETSYIPTNGTTITRGWEVPTMTGTDLNDVFNPTEGTMFYEASVSNLTNGNQPIVAFRDVSNTAASYHAMGHAIGGSPGTVRTWARDASANNVHLTSHSGLVAGSFYNHMYGYKYNNYSDAFRQGTTSAQTNTTSGDYSMLTAGLIDELRFGGYYSSPESTTYSLEAGHIKRFSYWRTKLSNTQIKTYVS